MSWSARELGIPTQSLKRNKCHLKRITYNVQLPFLFPTFTLPNNKPRYIGKYAPYYPTNR